LPLFSQPALQGGQLVCEDLAALGVTAYWQKLRFLYRGIGGTAEQSLSRRRNPANVRNPPFAEIQTETSPDTPVWQTRKLPYCHGTVLLS
jgi:hypothetical protein